MCFCRQELADLLPKHSFDVLGIIVGYAVVPAIKKDAKPRLLYTFNTPSKNIRDIVCIPNTDRVWIIMEHSVLVYKINGKLLFTAAKGTIVHPQGMTVDAENSEVYVSCEGKHIVVCGYDGKLRRRFSPDVETPFMPHGLAFDSNGALIVTSLFFNKVAAVTREGKLIQMLAPSKGKFSWPSTVKVNSKGNIFVVDHGTARIQVRVGFVALCHMDVAQVFNSSRAHVITLDGFGVPNDLTKHKFLSVPDIAVDYADHLFVIDTRDVRVCKDAGDHLILITLAVNDDVEDAFSERPSVPHTLNAICIDSQHRIVVGDSKARMRVFAFDESL